MGGTVVVVTGGLVVVVVGAVVVGGRVVAECARVVVLVAVASAFLDLGGLTITEIRLTSNNKATGAATQNHHFL